MFDPKSRYYGLPTFHVRDARGRWVEVVPAPAARAQPLRGIHLLREGERVDHLAARYLFDPAGFWRIAERNDAMRAEALTERAEIEIPVK